MEGTRAQGVWAFALRRSRSLGWAKPRRQHVASAAVMHLVRLGVWWVDLASGTPKPSAFAWGMKPVAA
jgi:hypothetical protein